MSKRKISPKGARAKGHNFERAIAQAFVDIGWIHAKRHLEYQAVEANGCDLDHTHPFVVQCKKHAKYVNPSVIEEIKNLREDEIPLVVTAGNNKPAMAILPFEKFLLLARIAKLYSESQAKAISESAKAVEWKNEK